ncbi:MAG: T9SS type A sorting domain-containing protein [Bacteroidota bacterium]|nr:T9SS type A sorting domain-containing protein [Bacteroidota bacterium]
MNTLKAIKRTIEAILITAALAMPLKAQNTISGHLQSVPTTTNAHSGVTLTAVPGPFMSNTESDSTTGDFSLNVPDGTYELMIKTVGHRRYVDTLTINSNQDLNIQVPEWIPTISTYFTDVIDLVNCLIDGYGSKGRKGLPRWRDEEQPIRVFHENTPADTIFTHNYEFAKTSGTAKFREADADSIVGVKFQYKPRSQIPFGGNGWTVVDTWYPDFTPKHMTVTIANDEPYPGVGTYLGELCRVLRLFNTSPDRMHVMFTDGNINKELSTDEGNALNIIYKLKLNTDTRKFKPIKDTTISGIKDYVNDNPDNFILEQNYPNPFNPSTNFKFSIARRSGGIATSQLTTLKVYDVLGREVATLLNEVMQPGEYSVKWDAEGVPSGVYFYRLSVSPSATRDLVPKSRDGQSSSFIQTRKAVLIK